MRNDLQIDDGAKALDVLSAERVAGSRGRKGAHDGASDELLHTRAGWVSPINSEGHMVGC